MLNRCNKFDRGEDSSCSCLLAELNPIPCCESISSSKLDVLAKEELVCDQHHPIPSPGPTSVDAQMSAIASIAGHVLSRLEFSGPNSSSRPSTFSCISLLLLGSS